MYEMGDSDGDNENGERLPRVLDQVCFGCFYQRRMEHTELKDNPNKQ